MFLIEHAHLRIFNDKKISRMDDRYKSFFLGTLVHGHYCLITEILPAVRKWRYNYDKGFCLSTNGGMSFVISAPKRCLRSARWSEIHGFLLFIHRRRNHFPRKADYSVSSPWPSRLFPVHILACCKVENANNGRTLIARTVCAVSW